VSGNDAAAARVAEMSFTWQGAFMLRHRLNLTASAAIVAVTLALGPAAFAQSSMSSTGSGAASGSTQTIQPDQMRASKMIGAKVYDRDNQDIGSVKDLVLNKDGRVANVVVGVGGVLGIGDKDVAVPLSDVKLNNNRLTLDRTKTQLQQAANYRLQDRDTGAGSSSVPVTGGRGGSATTH
jgi:sporulation protein YlmC with PRC-barrel domain